MKVKINMIGGGFQHDVCSQHGSTPKYIEWIKKNHTANISFYMDKVIPKIIPNPKTENYAWVMESKSIIPQVYQWCKDNVQFIETHYKLLFTHEIALADLSPNFHFIKWKGKPWIKDYGIHPKSKKLSMITSSKNWCDQHDYRLKIANKFKDQMDLFGKGFNPISKKEDGLKDYYYSIAMENHTYLNSYSEKLTDCFATGTIPIYSGSHGIGEIFNDDGIIKLTDDLDINMLTPNLYFSKMKAIEENLKIVKNMPIPEDYMYLEFIK